MVEQKIIDYIKEGLAAGKSKEDIYKDLLSQGQTINAIGEGFTLLSQAYRKEDSQKRITKIIVSVGAILVGAGILSFVAANWQEIGKFYKILIILCSMLASYYGGWILKEKYHRVKTGEALILLGSIIYGAGIFLVGQMFNIRANWPDAFILWMFGLMALGLALDFSVILYLAIPVGFVAIAGHPFDIFNGFMEDRFLLASSFMLLIATIATFIFGVIFYKKTGVKDISNSNLKVHFSQEDTLSQLFFLLSVCFMAITAMAFNQKLGNIAEWPLIILLASFVCAFLSYRFKGVLLLPVSLIGLFSWWFIKSSEWIDQGHNATDVKDLALFSLPLIFSLFIYIVGLIHDKNRKFERYAAVYNVLPIVAVTAALFIISTEVGIEAFLEMTEGADLFSSWQITLSYVFGGLVFISSVFYSFWKNFIKPVEGMALLIYGIVFGFSAFLPDISEKDLELHLATFVNIFLLVHLVALLFAGYLKKKNWLINLGSFSLFIFIIIKYFDWAFDFLDKSVFFISAGILLLVLGWFMERGRRYMISSSQTII